MTFRNTTKANCLFWLMYIRLIYRKVKNRQVVNLPIVYTLSAFFSFWGDLGALVGELVVLFLLVAGHQLGTYPKWYRNAQSDSIRRFRLYQRPSDLKRNQSSNF